MERYSVVLAIHIYSAPFLSISSDIADYSVARHLNDDPDESEDWEQGTNGKGN